jgi:hypothetical protein
MGVINMYKKSSVAKAALLGILLSMNSTMVFSSSDSDSYSGADSDSGMDSGNGALVTRQSQQRDSFN